MFGKGIVSMETLFTFPNPLLHLLGNLVSITLERQKRMKSLTLI